MKPNYTVKTLIALILCTPVYPLWGAEAGSSRNSVFARDNLVAWCIVPFDASKRGPQARAAMLQRLGIKKVAYDWRPEHILTFEQEILAYKEHGLVYFAFWGWHASMEPLIKKYGISPQMWQTNPSPKTGTQAEKVKATSEALMPLVEQTRKLGLKLGLYNHGGWGGEPGNLVAVCQWLRTYKQADHVGIVYNLHHAHEHIDDFSESLALMKPYLVCLNINGMNANALPKIVPLGQGQHERTMLATIAKSGYRGPIGILDHRSEMDTEESLKENLDGLKQILREMGDLNALKTFDPMKKH